MTEAAFGNTQTGTDAFGREEDGSPASREEFHLRRDGGSAGFLPRESVRRREDAAAGALWKGTAFLRHHEDGVQGDSLKREVRCRRRAFRDCSREWVRAW